MQEIAFEEAVELVRARDARYARDAYLFLREALDFTQKIVAKKGRGRIRHVSGQELLDGVRQYALNEFGPMAPTVFEHWGVHSCRDFGEIVFNMVDIGLLAKTEKDSRTDFQDGYEFFDAFRKPYLPTPKLAPTETAPAQATGC